MDRTERVLSLLTSLLAAREPAPVDQIRSWFADYREVSNEAFERKFERDKQALRRLGIPLRCVTGDDGIADGYIVLRDETYLDPIELGQDELAVLEIAGHGMLRQRELPFRRDLQRALDKIELLAEPDRVAAARAASRRVLLNHPLQQAGRAVSAHLDAIIRAMDEGRRLRMVYHALYSGQVGERTVDPYGLRCWRGRWAVVGYCHERDDVRLFSLHRMRELQVVEGEPGVPDFTIPENFSLARWQMQPPWRFHMHAPVVARVEVDVERAWMVEGQLGVPAGEPTGGWVPFELEVTHTDGLVEWALRQGPAARVVAPDAARERVIAALRAALAANPEDLA